MACSVLACIWPPEGKQVWTTHHETNDLDDAPAIFACFSRRLHHGQLDLGIFSELTPEEFFAGDGTLQLLPERWRRLNEVADTLHTEWHGSAANLVAAAGSDTEQVVQLADGQRAGVQ